MLLTTLCPHHCLISRESQRMAFSARRAAANWRYFMPDSPARADSQAPRGATPATRLQTGDGRLFGPSYAAL